MKLVKLKKVLLSALFLTIPFNSTAILGEELLKSNNKSLLIAEAKDYREHDDNSKNEDDFHSNEHDWKNHYHTIRSIKLRRNGNLKIRFCEKVELLEGQVYADDIKYDVKDAYKITKRKIVWRLNKKGTFERGEKVEIDTKSFLGRPIEKEPNLNEIRSLTRGCALPFLYLPPGVEVTGNSSGMGILGFILAVGVAIGGGSSGGTGSTSHN